MVQVPTTTTGSSSTMRASPASGTNSNTTSTRGKPATTSNANNPAAAPLPLSAMHSLPLDMTSVERRGQPTASRETIKRIRPHKLQEAPTYRPTLEEFKDPFEYMKKIAPEASQYGICKIIPPDSWKPDFSIDTERFHFRTRKQELNSVEGSTRANLTYLDQLAKFHKQNGTNLNRFPSVDKRPLDLYKLKKAVETRGGFERVCKHKKWAEIGRDLGYSGKIMSSLSTSLKNSYQRWLHPYEVYLSSAKPGVHQQLEYEYGGPLTPSPANSPLKKSHQHTPSSLRGDSPAIRASDALNASMKEEFLDRGMKNIPRLDSPAATPTPTLAPQPQSATSGFTAVNAGGFTPVNTAPATFTPVANNRREREENGFTPPRRQFDTPIASAKNTPEYRPSALGSAPVVNGFTSNPMLKRQLSHDSLDSRGKGSQPEDNENGGRRSKRLKKDAVPTVAGSHMTLFRPTQPRIPGEHGSFAPGEKCEQCGKAADDSTIMLICESCNNGYHMACLDPQVTQKQDNNDWYCPRCLVGDGQFGFEEGGIYSLKQFQQKAAEFKETYFQNKMPFDPVFNCPRPVTEDDIEREFWRLVASLEETITVEYGADIHSTTHGSGFPTIEKNPLDPYSNDPWNLNILPLHADSLFRHIKSDISGMTVPWLYVGMIFSTFCWHNEDHYAYSANYQHFGSTKTWYGIPGEDAERFEAAMREAVPELFETQPDLLFQLVTLMTPEQLKKAGVRVYALDQRAGQFVITFPQAYHAGFNHGFNFNEAVNFAPNDWEPYGDAGVERLQQFRRQPCFSHDELLWTAAEGAATGGVTIATAKWLAPALERLRDRELAQRRHFLDKHKEKHADPCVATDDTEGESPRCQLGLGFAIDEEDVPEEEYQCTYCKAYAYISRFKCDTSGKVMCLLHAGNYECCSMTEDQRYAGKNHTLHCRRTAEALEAIHIKVNEKAQLPEAWEEKVMTAMQESAQPSLKVLRALVNEGERIPFNLKSLPDLKQFVDKCNEWVEEATNYIVRKQQNRRKNEKAWRKGSKAAEMEERDREYRKVENINKLIEQAERLGFDCPEITQLNERAAAIKQFRADVSTVLQNVALRKTTEFEDLLEKGRSFNVDLPEVDKLDKMVQQMKWNDRARDNRGQFLTLKEVDDLIEEGEKLEIPEYNEFLGHYKEQSSQGRSWEIKATELISAELIHYPQLEALSAQAQAAALPVSAETLAAVDQILDRQRDAHRRIVSLYDRSRNEDFKKRPKYQEVRDTMDQLAELNSKPNGTLDLEKEQKRHEDWMRKGKKLFGKANAPLHILKSHMEYVFERNVDCFDIESDKPRMPAEPASREPSPSDAKLHSWEDPRFREVFCICRRIEAGMMIECELCHEWYHGKCLKIARGKVKDDEKYTCPICDWRVKIPRDAARPKLEDLQAWQDEIPALPFQPDEEEVLAKIIDNAQDFRSHVAPFCNPVMATADECETQRFYLRKIEGAEILLSYETNFFRQELHKWSPVAPEAPPLLEVSKSTRKPRPTKLQKLMAQHGVEDPEQLPQSVRIKPHIVNKRKSSEPSSSRPPPLQPAPGRSDSGTPTSHSFPSSATMHPHGGPTLSGLPSAHDHAHPAHFGGYADPHFSMASSSASPAFAPHAFLPGGMQSPGFGSRQPGIFNDAAYGSIDSVALGPGTDSPMRETFGESPQDLHGVSKFMDPPGLAMSRAGNKSKGKGRAENNEPEGSPSSTAGDVGTRGRAADEVSREEWPLPETHEEEQGEPKWGADVDMDLFLNEQP
ncbi:PLU-1-domain-containing protein [Mollisia scopiformis]|uniref:PLU-1-domain-containing protein n=1 Tax=Mollisia scopiformis TaxID=149040 RepID=A0A194XC18_MOLSC|nr:PLU-1-domain-containing protein [Mollisia scopiformis]KUJ17709.1 PLU-1-domain-containing protein [Mollisia scopiformis]